jgi:hypothetical protein
MEGSTAIDDSVGGNVRPSTRRYRGLLVLIHREDSILEAWLNFVARDLECSRCLYARNEETNVGKDFLSLPSVMNSTHLRFVATDCD